MEDVVKLRSDGFTPETCSMSDAKSDAARCTPGHSSSERRMGVALPLFTTVNMEDADLNATHVSWPIARTGSVSARRPRTAKLTQRRAVIVEPQS